MRSYNLSLSTLIFSLIIEVGDLDYSQSRVIIKIYIFRKIREKKKESERKKDRKKNRKKKQSGTKLHVKIHDVL